MLVRILRLRRAVALLWLLVLSCWLRRVALLHAVALQLRLAVRWGWGVGLAVLAVVLEGGLVGGKEALSCAGGVRLVLFVVGGIDGAEEHFERLRVLR